MSALSLKATLIGLVMNSFWISSSGTHQYSPHKDPHCCVLPIKYGKGFTLKGSSCLVNYGSFCTIHFTSSIWECCQSRRSGKVRCVCVCEGLCSRELWRGVKHKHTRSAMWLTEAVLSELQDHLDWGNSVSAVYLHMRSVWF